ncbi:MAG: NUDIX domain-containing protein [Nocardioidaceae bacterium]|nr:NUDIX domain-containing protein [Nocardioidaceae bacterium]
MATRPGLAVAAAIVLHGRLLAARRTEPAALAGSWELPGGKVDTGEDPERALVRELGEELDCEVEVLRRLPGEQPLTGGHRLWVYECRLDAGEPQPLEHDALRWLAPEELADVAWLPADQPFVNALRDRLLDGEPMAGGNVGGAVRIGSTVRRPTGPWTPAVHALLAHLGAAGLDGVPRVLGVDERGREVLTYVPGRVAAQDGETVRDVDVQQLGEWLRRYHAAVLEFRPPAVLRWRTVDRPLEAGEIVCHHDVAPYNAVMDGDRLVGVIDWDMAGPGRPLEDLSFAAWNCVPLHADVGAAESARRLRLLCSAYGGAEPGAVLAGVVPRIETAVAKIAAGQRAGDPGMCNLAAVGEPERTAKAVARLRVRLPAITAELG